MLFFTALGKKHNKILLYIAQVVAAGEITDMAASLYIYICE